MLSAVLVLALTASIVFTLRALLSRTWMVMWMAAFASLVASTLGVYSIGAVIFLVTCLQIAVAAALRRGASWLGLAGALFLGALTWIVIVPGQIYGSAWLGGFSVNPLIGVLGSLVVLLPIVTYDRTARGGIRNVPRLP
jgi:hypothetical protein